MKKKSLPGAHLTPEEKKLALIDRNRICSKELRDKGFISDCRLADAAEVPQQSIISLVYDNGTIMFQSLPFECKDLT